MYPKYPYYSKELKCKEEPITFPPQHQNIQPGIESIMNPIPITDNKDYIGSEKLKNKVAIITGGDSGIGKSVAIAFAKEKANLCIVYLYEKSDALATKCIVEGYGARCILIEGDLTDESFSDVVVNETLKEFGHIDILVNNIAVQYPQESILDITSKQLDKTFKTNIFSYFYLTKAVLPYLKDKGSIINTTSITAYEGHKDLIDYSSTKGAVVSFTRSLSLSLINQGIRVNAVAPGPVWTPLIPSSFSSEKVSKFGLDVPMKRAAQPFELAPTYVYLASDDSRYVSGQVLHVNGGAIVDS